MSRAMKASGATARGGAGRGPAAAAKGGARRETAAAAKGGREPADDARDAWRLLAPLVYPPPFLRIAREHDLRPAAFGALRMLDEPRAMSEIAAFLHCDNSNVTGIVDGLEEKGLARREPAPHDRRVKLIALTAAGRRLHGRLMQAVEVPPDWMRRLSAEDQRALGEILARADPADPAERADPA